jgi:hypothetical protein
MTAGEISPWSPPGRLVGGPGAPTAPSASA